MLCGALSLSFKGRVPATSNDDGGTMPAAGQAHLGRSDELQAARHALGRSAMKVRTDPLARYRDHLVLIEEMIAVTEVAIGKHQQAIRQMLRDGADLTAETHAIRANAKALRRLQADRDATLNQISRHKT
jgi:hypothetical protein